VLQSLKLCFYALHFLLGQFDPGLIRGRHQCDYRIFLSPGHDSGILDHGVHCIEQGTIPVLFQIPQQRLIALYLLW
jgi:hypothetical protein